MCLNDTNRKKTINGRQRVDNCPASVIIIKRTIEEDTPIPKMYADELNNLVAEGLNHEQIAAYMNLRQNKILRKAYRAPEKNQPKRTNCTKTSIWIKSSVLQRQAICFI